MFYEIRDTYGAPQCGCNVKRFTEWYDVEEYIEMNPDVMERLDSYDAFIIHREESHYLLDSDEYPFYTVVLPGELPGMFAGAIEYGYGTESDYADWITDMERLGILTLHD